MILPSLLFLASQPPSLCLSHTLLSPTHHLRLQHDLVHGGGQTPRIRGAHTRRGTTAGGGTGRRRRWSSVRGRHGDIGGQSGIPLNGIGGSHQGVQLAGWRRGRLLGQIQGLGRVGNVHLELQQRSGVRTGTGTRRCTGGAVTGGVRRLEILTAAGRAGAAVGG